MALAMAAVGGPPHRGDLGSELQLINSEECANRAEALLSGMTRSPSNWAMAIEQAKAWALLGQLRLALEARNHPALRRIMYTDPEATQGLHPGCWRCRRGEVHTEHELDSFFTPRPQSGDETIEIPRQETA